MKLLRISALLLTSLAMACGGSKNKAEKVIEAPVVVLNAYYITEVGGTPDAGSTNKYIFELQGSMAEVKIDSIWIEGKKAEFMQMPGRPVIYAATPGAAYQGNLKARIRGSSEKGVFYLEVDALEQKEKIYLPSSNPMD